MMMSDRQVRIIISGEAASLIRAAGQAEGALRRVGQSGQQAGEQTSSFGENLKKAAAAAGVVTGFAAVAGAIKYVVTQGTSFQDNMNSLRAVTGASAGQMDRLSGVARALGKDIDLPATSAGDAAEAMLELAKGGLSVNQSMAAAKGSLLLAAAAQVTGAQAAQIQVNALNMFRLSADQAGMVADVLANSANAASGEITDMAQALAMSGTTANSFGIDIDDTATVLALFAKNGQIGSTAGTTFNTMLSMMANPSKQAQEAIATLGLTLQNSNGEFVGARSLTEQLAAARGRLTQAEFTQAAAALFGQDAQKGANILATEGVAAYDAMNQKVTALGGAQTFAAAQTQGVSGAFGKFMSAVEDASVALFDKFSPALESGLGIAAELVGALSGLVTWVGNLPGPVLAGAAAFGTFLLLRGPLNALFLQAVAGYQRMGIAAVGAAAEARAAGLSMATFGAVAKGALAALGGPLGIALTAGAVALSFFAGSSDEAAGSTADFTGAIDENTGALSANAPAVIASASAKSGAFAAYKAIGGSVKEYTDALLGNTGAQDALHTRLLDSAEAALKTSGAWGRMVSKGLELSSNSRKVASDILATGDAGQYASEGMDAALNASALYASESDKLGTEATQTNDVLTVTGGATKAVGDAASETSPLVSAMADAFKASSDAMDQAVQNAKDLADNTALSGMLNAAAAASDDAKRALDGFNLATEEASKRNETLDDAAASYQKALTGLGDAFKSGTQAAKDNTDAGNLNLDALREWNVSTLTATSDGQKMYDSLTAIAEQHTATTAAAYSDAVAHGDLAGANDKARAAATASRGEFVKLATQYLGNEQQANDLADQLGILDGQKIDDKTFKTISDDAQARESFRQIEALKFQQKIVEITAIDNATYSVYNIQKALDAMSSYKQIVVNTAYTTSGSSANPNPGSSAVRADGGTVMAAAGRMVSGRGVSMVADGSGAGLTWAEAATNKEYYLSMKDGMRDRNRGLASDAVRDLGGQAVWGSGAGSYQPMPGVVTSAAPINVAAPNVTVYVDGHMMTPDRVQVMVDNGFNSFAGSLLRQAGQGT